MLTYHIANTVSLFLFALLNALNLHDYRPVPPDALPPRPEERLFILIPARNEAENIRECLAGLQAQTYSNFTLLVLDDASEDGTSEIVESIAREDLRIELLMGKPIETGWAGKVWACSQLGAEAQKRGADWLLFLDADTRALPGLVAAGLHHAQTHRAGMVSTFPYQTTGSFWERVVLPMIHFLICTFLPLRLVWGSKSGALVAGCGQFELFSAEAYRATGGHAGIPGSFHDGLRLARKTKSKGFPVRLFDGSPLMTCRMYDGGKAVWNGFTRNAYEGLGGFIPLVGMTFLQSVLFLFPFGFLLYALVKGLLGSGIPQWGGLVALQVALIYTIRVMQAKRFGHGETVWLHPLSVTALIAIQWASFFKSLRKTKVAWKGRIYG